MIGPSSSHTAGAARLARAAALIAGKPFKVVTFGLSGSFAKTGKGHGTEKALLAGALGLAADDERIRQIEKIAAKQGVESVFYQEDLDWMHENAVHISFFHADGSITEVWGASIGGGRIRVRRIGSLRLDISTDYPTLILPHLDLPGVVSEVSGVLAKSGLNIAVMRMSREGRGKMSMMVIELDASPSAEVVEELRRVEHVTEVALVDLPQL